jgi:hypothetical protein
MVDYYHKFSYLFSRESRLRKDYSFDMLLAGVVENFDPKMWW